jgi:NAD(P)-dependent dehydrogenase (short-subunit alcohol dehydrogenase family)
MGEPGWLPSKLTNIVRRKEVIAERVLEAFRPDLFAGKTVLISGATSGIGLEMARGFAALAAKVIAAGTSDAKIKSASADPANTGVEFRRLDVRDGAAIDALIGSLKSLDVVVNCAGISHGGSELTDVAKFVDVVDVNLNGMMRVAHAARPLLARSKGCIINIASMLSYLVEGKSNVVGYTASKTGVLGLTRALAHSIGEDGIRVNAISPGYHKTDMTKPLWSRPDSEALVRGRTALNRWGTTYDLVGYAVFLASPAAEYVTGTELPVDGGYVIGNVVF